MANFTNYVMAFFSVLEIFLLMVNLNYFKGFMF